VYECEFVWEGLTSLQTRKNDVEDEAVEGKTREKENQEKREEWIWFALLCFSSSSSNGANLTCTPLDDAG